MDLIVGGYWRSPKIMKAMSSHPSCKCLSDYALLLYQIFLWKHISGLIV